MTAPNEPTLYKTYRKPLEDAAAAWFAAHGCVVDNRRPYILASHNDWKSNLLDPRIYALVESVRPRHSFVHHGLSSQALCFNLFGSLLLRNSLGTLREAVAGCGADWPTGACEGQFEFDDRDVFNESGRDQPTSWDFAVGSPGAYPSVLFEIKFVEQSVGACSVFARGDCDGANAAAAFESCFLHRVKGRRYWAVLEEEGFLQRAPFTGTICPMTIYYQFYREVAFVAAKRLSMVYLFDDRNPAFSQGSHPGNRGLLPLLLKHLPERMRQRVCLLPLSTLVASLQASGDVDWLHDFRRKYAL